LLKETAALVRKKGRPVNVDVTVIAQAPKLGPYKNRMRAKIAHALRIAVERVSVKAKTNEGMGWIGKGEGLAAVAVVTIQTKER